MTQVRRADSRFARAVNAEGREAFDARDGAVQDDGATVVKQRQSLLYREECSPDVQSNDFVEMLLSHLANGGELTTTRAGEKNINLAFLLPDCFVKPIEIIEIGGIAQNPGDNLADLLYR